MMESAKTVLSELREVGRQHYMAPEIVAQRVAALGVEETAAILREELPTSKRGRSADIGEILATEFVRRELGFDVPIHRLQWKDGREMALRGDDVIAYAGDGQAEKLRFLKGEAKSRASLGAGVIDEAVAALDRDKGRPSRHSVLFVATRLRERGEHEVATLLENAVLDGFRNAEIEHLLFTLCGNDPDKHLSAYLEEYRKRTRKRHAVGLRVEDQAGFIRSPLRRARSAPRSGVRGGLRDLRERGAESRRRGAGGGKACENWPFYDEGPVVTRRGFCKP